MDEEKKYPAPKKIRVRSEVYELAQEVAKKLSITPGKIQNGIRNGHIRSVKEHGRLYVVVESVESFLLECKKYKPGTLWRNGWNNAKISYNFQKNDSR